MSQLLQKVAAFVELSAAESQAAQRQLAEQATKQAGYKAEVSESVAKLVRHGFLKESAVATATQQLQDPNYALQSLVKMALSRPPEVPTQLGTQVPSDASQQSGGRAAASAPRQRDIDFVASLGLPTEFA